MAHHLDNLRRRIQDAYSRALTPEALEAVDQLFGRLPPEERRACRYIEHPESDVFERGAVVFPQTGPSLSALARLSGGALAPWPMRPPELPAHLAPSPDTPAPTLYACQDPAGALRSWGSHANQDYLINLAGELVAFRPRVALIETTADAALVMAHLPSHWYEGGIAFAFDRSDERTFWSACGGLADALGKITIPISREPGYFVVLLGRDTPFRSEVLMDGLLNLGLGYGFLTSRAGTVNWLERGNLE